jgi:hypothetical protein
MANKNNSERIERYLREQMSPEENDAFLNELQNDKELREEAQMMALMIQGMKEERARQDAEVTEKAIAANELVKKPAAMIRRLRWPLSIAAMFVLIFGTALLWNNRQSDTKALFNDYYEPYTVQGTPRSPFGTDSEVKEKLVTLFNQVGTAEDISPVIKELQAIYDSIDSEYEYSIYVDDVAWYLALAYLKDNKLEKAKELLKPLADNGNEKAKKLMEKIN